MVRGYVPAWCEHHSDPALDGRYVVACYFTREGHPVSKARAERVELAEYAPDGTLLRIEEGVIDGCRFGSAVTRDHNAALVS